MRAYSHRYGTNPIPTDGSFFDSTRNSRSPNGLGRVRFAGRTHVNITPREKRVENRPRSGSENPSDNSTSRFFVSVATIPTRVISQTTYRPGTTTPRTRARSRYIYQTRHERRGRLGYFSVVLVVAGPPLGNPYRVFLGSGADVLPAHTLACILCVCVCARAVVCARFHVSSGQRVSSGP